MVGEPRGYEYVSFDDDVARAAAEADPVGFVAGLPDKVILDEVQRVPGLFLALKSAIDRNRVPGRFLLTGSSNLMLLPQLSDSLAGRMELVRLHPLSQCELERHQPGFLDALFGATFATGSAPRLANELSRRIVSGGYPSALSRASAARRAAWYRDYLEAMIQKDVRDLARISSLEVLPRLLAACAAQTSRLFNVSELSAPFRLSRPTIRDYLTLLERTFLVELLSPWHTNRLSRLIKTPKLHLCDTGIASSLLRVTPSALEADRNLYGQLVETFVVQELGRQASSSGSPIAFYHMRDKDGVEVDLVLEGSGGKIAGVEVKAGATVGLRDFAALRKLEQASGERFACGAVLYDGETSAPFGNRLFALPIRSLWEVGP